MLRIEIIGNLGSDPEQRFTGEGVAMTSIRVAVNSRRTPFRSSAIFTASGHLNWDSGLTTSGRKI